MMAEPIYIDEDFSHDHDGAASTQTKSYKTLLHAMILHPPGSTRFTGQEEITDWTALKVELG